MLRLENNWNLLKDALQNGLGKTYELGLIGVFQGELIARSDNEFGVMW